MRNIIFIIAVLFTTLGYSQGGPKMNVAKFVGDITTTVRNTLDVPTSETWLIFNVTTEQFEYAGSDDSWIALGGSGIDWSDPVDNNIIPDTDSSYDLGSLSNSFNDAWFEDLHIVDKVNSEDWYFSGSNTANDNLGVYEWNGSSFLLRYTFAADGTIDNSTNLINRGYLQNGLADLGSVIDASGFSGNLTGTDDTLQEIANALDGLTTGTASEVNITDSGDYYTGTEVETALQEVGLELSTKIDSIAQDTSPELGGDLNMNGNFVIDNIIPSSDAAYNLGSSSYYFNNAYIRTPIIETLRLNTSATPSGVEGTIYWDGVNHVLRAYEGTQYVDILDTSDLIDDDTFATATSINIPSSESVKAYVDAEISGTGAVPDDTGSSDGDVLTTDGAGTYTWETPSGGGSGFPVDADEAIIQDQTDNTKQIDWDLSGITTSTKRTITMPDADVDLGGLTSSNLAANSVGSSEITDGSVTGTDIASNTIPLSKLSQLSIDGFLGNNSGSTSNISTLTPTEARTLINVEDGAAADQTLSLGGTGNKDLTISGTGGNTIDLTGVDGIDADNIVSKGTARTSPTQYTDIYGQTQTNYTTDGAPSAGELVIITDASPAEVVTSATIEMEGWKMYDDQTTDAATITLSDCDAGETLTVYINRASAPTLAGTGLTFNQLPNTTAFAGATEMMIIFEVAYDGTTIDYYYVER